MQTAVTPGKLVTYRADRFGARLTSLVNARRLANKYNLELAVYWNQGTGFAEVYNDPTETFSQEFVDEHFISKREWRQRQENAVTTSDAWSMTSTELIKTLQSGKNVFIEMAYGILCLADEKIAQVEVEFAEAFETLPRSQQLVGLFESIGSKFKGATAYHIRRGDLVDGMRAKNRNWSNKFVPAKFYEFHMRETFEKDAKVVLFSDEIATIETYKKAFPKALSLIDVIGDIEVTQAGRDFLELYSMSRCAKIIAPAQSAFSGAAASLSKTKLTSLIDDLTPANRDRMFEDLTKDLEATPDPDYSDGEVGQCLAHVTTYLEGKGRKSQAIKLAKLWIDRGLNITHVYSKASEDFTKENDFDSVLEITKQIDKGYVVFVKDQTLLDYGASFAHFNLGDHKQAVFRAQSAFSASPWHTANRRIIGAMLSKGLLNQDNFFPTNMKLLTLEIGNKAIVRTAVSDMNDLEVRYPKMLFSKADSKQARVTTLAPILLDWAMLLPPSLNLKKSSANLQTTAINPILSAISKKRGIVGNKPWMGSFVAMCELHFGDSRKALDDLQKIYLDAPNALNAFRCSTAFWRNDQFSDALEWASTASENSSAPAYKVWFAHCLMNSGEFDKALVHLDSSVAPLSGFATVLEIQARLYRRLEDDESAKQIYSTIEKIAPLAPGIRRQQAMCLWDLGEHQKALDALQGVFETRQITAQGYALLGQYLNKLGRNKEAASVLLQGRAEFPQSDKL